jgi:hypothetical protein
MFVSSPLGATPNFSHICIKILFKAGFEDAPAFIDYRERSLYHSSSFLLQLHLFTSEEKNWCSKVLTFR